MDRTAERLSRTIWIGVGLVIVLICMAYVLSQVETKRKSASNLPVISQISDFTLTNQSGQKVTLDELRGHVWIADIIFSRCPGPCPRMTQQMKSLLDALPANSKAKLVTLTTDPVFDTPEVLSRYATRFGTNSPRWLFLTGDKKEITKLAIDGLKLVAMEKDEAARENPADLFIHSTYFVAVDKQGRLRALFETMGDGIEWTNIQPAIMNAVKELEAE
jgi:protein SCO1/2